MVRGARKDFLILFLALIMGFCFVVFMDANADSENLFVDGFVPISNQWSKIGTTPYLEDDDDYIYTQTDLAIDSYYTFTNSSGAGTINYVYLYFECYANDGPSDDYFRVYIWDGGTLFDMGNIAPDGSPYAYKYKDVTTELDTWNKIDSSYTRIVYKKVKGADEVWIRRCYLNVSYTTLEPEPSVVPPSDPIDLFGAGFNDSSPYVELHWNHSLVDVQFFEVQNSSDGISWDYLGQNTTAQYTDFQVVNGTERYYRVRACKFTDGAWYNSSWTDVNFEKVYFILAGNPSENGVAEPDYTPYMALGIILLLFGLVIGSRVKR